MYDVKGWLEIAVVTSVKLLNQQLENIDNLELIPAIVMAIWLKWRWMEGDKNSVATPWRFIIQSYYNKVANYRIRKKKKKKNYRIRKKKKKRS